MQFKCKTFLLGPKMSLIRWQWTSI